MASKTATISDMEIGDVVATGVVSTLTKAAGKKVLDVASQTLRDYRERNAPAFWTKFNSMVNPLGLEEPREVPPKIWYPIIDHGTLEDDDFLRTKYAALLANAVDPNFKHEVRPSFVEILKQLTPTEAKVFDDIYSFGKANRIRRATLFNLPNRVVKDESLNLVALKLIARSLARHGILDFDVRLPEEPNEHMLAAVDDRHIVLNHFGHEFFAACRPPSREA